MAPSLVPFLVISGFVGYVLGQSKVIQSEDGTAATIKFSTPNLDDDDAHSPWMPDMLKCDACRAVSFCVSTTKITSMCVCRGNIGTIDGR